MDESTDINDVAQLLIFIRFVDPELNWHDRLISMKALKLTTKGGDIFHGLQEAFVEYGIDMKKLVSVTTDKAQA